MTFPFPRRPLRWSEYHRDARDADVALWEARCIEGELIAGLTDGPFCHVTGVVHLPGGGLWSAGYEERRDGYLAPLDAAVRRHPGKISIFRAMTLSGTPFGRACTRDVAAHLVNDLDGDYEWKNIRLIALAHSVAGPLLVKSTWYQSLALQQSLKTRSAICSQHVHRSFRLGAHVDLVVNKRESLVTPNDIGKSKLLTYIGTLEPEEAGAAA